MDTMFFTFKGLEIDPWNVAKKLGVHMNRSLLTMFIKIPDDVAGGKKLEYVGSFSEAEEEEPWDWEFDLRVTSKTQEMIDWLERDGRFKQQT
jgi:hypothetical protein